MQRDSSLKAVVFHGGFGGWIFARETSGYTARAACDHVSSGGKEETKPSGGFPHYCKHLFENSLHIQRMVTIFETIIREGVEAGEFDVDNAAEAARAVRSAFIPFFHPILIEHCVQDEDTEAALRAQIRFILKPLGKSG